MRLPAAHRLGEIVGPCIIFSGQPFKTGGDQPLQPVSEVVAPKERITINFAMLELLKVGHLVDEAVTGDFGARNAKTINRG
jgi:hypothetical protein